MADSSRRSYLDSSFRIMAQLHMAKSGMDGDL